MDLTVDYEDQDFDCWGIVCAVIGLFPEAEVERPSTTPKKQLLPPRRFEAIRTKSVRTTTVRHDF